MEENSGWHNFLGFVRTLPRELADRLAFVLKKLDLQLVITGLQLHSARLLLRTVNTAVVEDLLAVDE